MKQHMNKLVIAFLVLLLTGITSFAQTTVASGTVTAGYLNVRVAPTAEAPILTTVSRGFTAGVIGKNSDSSWYEILIYGGSGWVNGRYLSITNAHTIPITYTNEAPPVNVTGLVTTGRLNVRSAPADNAEILTTITQNEVVSVTGKTSNSTWYRVNAFGTTGWVNGLYLSITNEFLVPVINDAPVPPPITASATVTAGRLNVRSAPSANATVVTRISQGDVVNVTGENSNSTWYEITAFGFTGWVNGMYLSIANEYVVPAVNAPSTNLASGVVNTGRLNIRTIPSPYFNQPITNVPRNTSLSIIGRNDNSSWLKVRTTYTGIEGWVSSRYVTFTSGYLNGVPVVYD